MSYYWQLRQPGSLCQARLLRVCASNDLQPMVIIGCQSVPQTENLKVEQNKDSTRILGTLDGSGLY
jgi:hypothetical protein